MAAGNNAFSLQGATPNQTTGSYPTGSGSTPQSMALNSLQAPKAQPYYTGGQALPAVGSPEYIQGQKMAQQLASLQPPTNQAVKSHTSADGTSQTYYPPSTFGGSTTGLLNIGAGAASGGVNNAASSLQSQANMDTSNPQSSTNQRNAQTVQGLLTGFAGGQSPEVIKAEQDYNKFAQDNPYMLAAQSNPNVAADVASGRDALLGRTFAAEQAAKAQQVQNALTGQAQQIGAAENAGTQALTGQQNQISAANSAGNLGVAQQGAQTTALGNAATQTHPEQLPYGVQYGTPEALAAGAGAPGAGGALNPLNNVNSIAQQVISGQISPSQAYAMGGNVSNWQGLLNQAIQTANPGFNTATAQGRYEANQTNTTTSGTAPVNAAAQSYGTTYNDLLDLRNTTQNVDQFGNLLLQSMKDTTGNVINPSDVKYANQTLSSVKNLLSSKQQAVFDSTYASLKSRISGLLATGGAEIPTQITSDANKILDGSLPLSSLGAVLQRITTEGNILTSNLQNKLNTAGGVIGAPVEGTNSNPAGI